MEALSKWFDVSRYDALKDLTLEQIYAELERRMFVYKARQQWETLDDKHRNAVIHHDTMIHSVGSCWRINGSLKATCCLIAMLSGQWQGTHCLTMDGQCIGWRIRLKKKCFSEFDYISEYLKRGGWILRTRCWLKLTWKKASSDDLGWTPEVLISQWQKHLKVPKPPEKDFRFGHKTFQKILFTRLSPLMDLIAWEQLNNQKIKYPVLAGILHPDIYARGSRANQRHWLSVCSRF